MIECWRAGNSNFAIFARKMLLLLIQIEKVLQAIIFILINYLLYNLLQLPTVNPKRNLSDKAHRSQGY